MSGFDLKKTTVLKEPSLTVQFSHLEYSNSFIPVVCAEVGAYSKNAHSRDFVVDETDLSYADKHPCW